MSFNIFSECRAIYLISRRVLGKYVFRSPVEFTLLMISGSGIIFFTCTCTGFCHMCVYCQNHAVEMFFLIWIWQPLGCRPDGCTVTTGCVSISHSQIRQLVKFFSHPPPSARNPAHMMDVYTWRAKHPTVDHITACIRHSSKVTFCFINSGHLVRWQTRNIWPYNPVQLSNTTSLSQGQVLGGTMLFELFLSQIVFTINNNWCHENPQWKYNWSFVSQIIFTIKSGFREFTMKLH